MLKELEIELQRIAENAISENKRRSKEALKEIFLCALSDGDIGYYFGEPSSDLVIGEVYYNKIIERILFYARGKWQELSSARIKAEVIPFSYEGVKFYSLRTATKEEALFDAIDKRDIEKVKKLIDEGINVNTQMDQRNRTEVFIAPSISPTPLSLAILMADLDIVKLLLSKGADTEIIVNGSNALGQVCLLMIEYLWRVEHDINRINFIEKAKPKLYKIAELLIGPGANVNFKSEGGNTPLKWLLNIKHSLAPRKETEELIELLKQHGAKE